jgi:triosephosphate isomerase
MRKKYVIANFKMNKTDEEVLNYLSTLVPIVVSSSSQVVLAVPYVSIKTAVEKVKGKNILIAGQNLNENDFGAFTGEVNGEMLAGVGAESVVVGHSERRGMFGETNEVINKKIFKALKNSLICIFCVGETLYERKNQLTSQVLQNEISQGLKGLYANELNHIVIAYEPIWAIGTGIVPTENEVVETVKMIRNILTDMYDDKISGDVSVLYGGSVNELNAKKIAHLEGVDGVLVGGASLVPEKFGKIVSAFEKKNNFES